MARKAWDWMWELMSGRRYARCGYLNPWCFTGQAITRSWFRDSHYWRGNIPGARLFEQPGIDHAPWRSNVVSDLIEEVRHFLTGSRGPVERDRVLATVLFTDIVGSTEAAALGEDHNWRGIFSIIITLSSVVTAPASAAMRSKRPAMASLLPSTARRAVGRLRLRHCRRDQAPWDRGPGRAPYWRNAK